MLTAVIAIAVIAAALAVIAGVLALAYKGALLHIDELEDAVRAKVTELDALSIAGPMRVDTTTGSHDELPIRDDIRHIVTAYCEGMWQHTQEQP